MAKLKAPLFSFGASGKLADSLVFTPWKGLNNVRQYVVPANPKTDAQNTQRGYVHAAVDKIHAALVLAAQPLVAADKSAYALWGSTYPTPRTWFNQAVKNWVDTKVKVKKANIFRAGLCSAPAHGAAVVQVYFSEETPGSMVNGKFYLGTSKTALIKIKAGGLIAGPAFTNGAAPYDDLVAGVTYYFQFRADVADPSEYCQSGIYFFKAT